MGEAAHKNTVMHTYYTYKGIHDDPNDRNGSLHAGPSSMHNGHAMPGVHIVA